MDKEICMYHPNEPCTANGGACVLDVNANMSICIGYEIKKDKLQDIYRDMLRMKLESGVGFRDWFFCDTQKGKDIEDEDYDFDNQLPICLLAGEDDIYHVARYGTYIRYDDTRLICGIWVEKSLDGMNEPVRTIDSYIEEINSKIAAIKFTTDDFTNTEKKMFTGYTVDMED